MIYMSNSEKRSNKSELLSAMKATSDKKLYIKYQCVYLHCDGKSISEIADMFNLHYKTVLKYIDKYHTNGIKSLLPKPRAGAPRKLTAEQENKLKEVITLSTPADVGFNSRMNWTASLAVQWVEREFGVKYTVGGMNYLLHRLNLSYTRPTYKLAKADVKKQEKFRKDFEDLKKS